MKKYILAFIKDEEGQDLVETSLLLVLIAAAAVLILTGLGTSIVGTINKIKTVLDESLANVD